MPVGPDENRPLVGLDVGLDADFPDDDYNTAPTLSVARRK